MEYASSAAILQVSFTLILILAVFILKKMKFSQVLSVEQNLNRTRVFNSAFTCGPGVCLIIGSIVLPVMSYKRMFPDIKSEQKLVIFRLIVKSNKSKFYSAECRDETAFFLFYSDNLFSFAISQQFSSEEFYKKTVDNAMEQCHEIL